MMKKFKKLTSVTLATVMIMSAVTFISPTQTANAQQVTGNAPFINSWLISGPFDSPVVDQIYDAKVEEIVNYAPLASVITASSSTLAANPVSNLVDGSTKQWVTERDTAPWVNLAWADPIAVNEVKIAQWGDSRHVNNGYHLTFTLEDETIVESGEVKSTSSNPSEPTVYTIPSGLKNVVGMKIEIDKGRTPYPGITGISEVEVYNKPAVTGGGSSATITPDVGETLSFDTESNTWEYFDDRLYNRNYDDYQDLHGYYEVKKGIDTKNKYVYAHSYVYSPKEQQAYFNVGASGSYRLYVNDKVLTAPTVPVEVQKDLTKQAIQLKQGWNKLMIQIKHTYTEDVNANNVPIGKDFHVAYLGFYGRIADGNGNKIEGLVHSTKDGSGALEIVTQKLSTEDAVKNELPTSNMPVGYKEWPYVWNKSTRDALVGVAATPFQFMASGGLPGYKWTIIEGELPGGLELNENGTIADGLVNGKVDLKSSKGIIGINTEPGDYNFTVQVTDLDGNTATKEMTLTVKERPNKWFEEGRVGALTHAAPSYNYFADPNFSADIWAERAKRQGHSLVSVEGMQQLYHWPSKFADPKHPRHVDLPKDANGQVVDGLKQFEEAVKRHGMKFGVYYATEGGGIGHHSTDVFMQNVEDLILRYDPAYLYFDGPQAMRSANYDVMYSIIRNYGDEIIVNSNAWGEEFGDPDLRTAEAAGIYENAGANHLLKRTPMEPWKLIRTKNAQSPYYGKRDDFRQVAKEMIVNAGRGYVDNNDQTPIDARGPFWNSPQEIATRYPIAEQEFIDVRETFIEWFAPVGKPERHESTTGTMPYYLAGYGYEDDGKGNYDKFAFPNSTTGPQWGYAMSRDNNIYLHVLKGADSKKGFDAITGKSLTIRPITDEVTSVTWLNENIPVTSFEQTGDSLTINLANVQEDPIDTIIKIVTDNATRKYTLTNVNATGEQLTPATLKINAEGYMTFPALKVPLSNVTFRSEDLAIATVDASGIVTPVSNGTTSITVSATYEGVTKQDVLQVTAKDGVIYVGESMIGATLFVNGKENYGEFSTLQGFNYQIEGRSSKGGAIGLVAADIQWHGGIVDLQAGVKSDPIVINEVNTFTFNDDRIFTPFVEQPTRGVVWADVTLGGKTFTTNKVFMDLLPTQNLAKHAEITASHKVEALDYLIDGKTIDGTHYDQSKWSIPANEQAWIQFKLPNKSTLANINLNFNSLDQRYLNTPKTIKVQTSADGEQWKEMNTINGPTGTAYFGFYNQYAINTEAQYVKFIFDGGSNGASMDVLEVAINGMDMSNMLDRFDFAYKPLDQTSGNYEIKAFTTAGDLINDGVNVTITSENPDVIKVQQSNLLTAVAEGASKIRIKVMVDGRSIESVAYLFVNQDGQIYEKDYLSKANLTLSSEVIRSNQPIIGSIQGILSSGEQVDLSEATVNYEFSDERVALIEGSNTIVLNGVINQPFKVKAKVIVTLNGVTVESDEVTITVLSGNIASIADVTVSSVRDRNGTPNGDNQDDRYFGKMVQDGNKSTSWAAKQADKSPWIKLQFPASLEISRINLIDRGHDVNQIVEGLLEWEGGSQKVKDIKWNGQPDNVVTFETPIVTSWIKFTIDPDNVYNNPGGAESGFAEFEVFAVDKEFVKTIVDYKSVTVDTTQGVIPSLPTQVEAVYNNGTTELVNVTWDAITADMVANEGIYTVNGTVEGTSLKAKAIYKVAGKTVPTGYMLTATGDASVITGQSFDVTYILNNVAEFVYALDQTIHFDPSQVEILSVEALQSGFSIAGKKEEEGKVRILMASAGSGGTIKHTSPVLKVHFKAKETSQNVTSSIFVTDVAVAGVDGIETPVSDGSAYTIQIIVVDKAALQDLITSAQETHGAAVEGAGIGQYPVGSKATLQAAIDRAKAVASEGSSTQDKVDQEKGHLQLVLQAFKDSVNVAKLGDLNEDGKFSIGDLGLISASYGKISTDADWDKYQKADMNGDGKIDIVDIAEIASLILG